MMKVSLSFAQRLALSSQLLDAKTGLGEGKQGVMQAINRLGYVQIDTIAVIRRAHHHTLWTRLALYQPWMLDELQAQERKVFEYWGHGASYLPMKDYRYYTRHMVSFPQTSWTRTLYQRHRKIMPQVLKRIEDEGPLGSSDFKSPNGKKRGPWWDWKPAKTALELLMWRGDLMVTRRRNFQRVYDLTQKVLPRDVDTRMPEPEQVARFRIMTALNAHGLATEKEIKNHLNISGSQEIPGVLSGMIEKGEVVNLQVKGVDETKYYALKEVVERSASDKRQVKELHLLSPFDGMVIDRKRLRRLFEFSYSLECYQPKKKRRYGYFSLPILYACDFAGRLDPKADRKHKILFIRSIHLEPEFKPDAGFVDALSEKLRIMAEFNDCDFLKVENCSEEKLKSVLNRKLRA